MARTVHTTLSAFRYGQAIREEGLGGDGAAAEGAFLADMELKANDPFEALLDPKRDSFLNSFFQGFELPLNAAQTEQLHKLVSEECAYLDQVCSKPPDVPWIERARMFTAQACEWDRRLESILDASQLAALRAHEGGILDYKSNVLARSDPKTNCERVNFREDPTGERLGQKWAADIFGPGRDDPRLRVYATEYARQMLEIGVPDYETEGRASLAYRLRQLEIHASIQKMMLEDDRFSEEELSQIRAWHELYEGDR